MSLLHLFACTGRFRSYSEMRSFVDVSYSDDGESLASAFVDEVGLEEYEPGCIEVIHAKTAMPLSTLLIGASYYEQWLSSLSSTDLADAAICIFEPNTLVRPDQCSLKYYGSFEYRCQREP